MPLAYHKNTRLLAVSKTLYQMQLGQMTIKREATTKQRITSVGTQNLEGQLEMRLRGRGHTVCVYQTLGLIPVPQKLKKNIIY